MAHDSLTEKRRAAQRGAVDELVGDNKLGRLMLQLERSHGGNGDDPFHAQFFHGEDIGAEIQFGWQDAMAPAVAGQKSHLPSLQLAQDKYVRGIAERRGYLNLVRIGETGHRIEPASRR